MSTEDERSVPRDIFSTPPADLQQSLPNPGRYQYATAGAGGAFAPGMPAYAPRPMPHARKHPGPVRRILSYVAVIWGGLTILLTLIHGFAHSASGAYHGGQFLGLLMAIALVVGGYQEIRSNHLRRVRYLPWLLGVETVLVALAIVAILALRPAYPASLRTGFMDSCQAHGGSSSYCGCTLNWFESNRSLSQFIADASGTAPTSRTDLAEAAVSCTAQR